MVIIAYGRLCPQPNKQKKCKKLEEIKTMFKDIEIDLDQIDPKELQNFMIIFKDQNDTRVQGKVNI